MSSAGQNSSMLPCNVPLQVMLPSGDVINLLAACAAHIVRAAHISVIKRDKTFMSVLKPSIAKLTKGTAKINLYFNAG